MSGGNAAAREDALRVSESDISRRSVTASERSRRQTSATSSLGFSKITYKAEPDSCEDCRIDCSEVIRTPSARRINILTDCVCDALRTVQDDRHEPAVVLRQLLDSQSAQGLGQDQTYREHGIRHGEPTWYYSYMGNQPHKDGRGFSYREHRF